jgi:hypothetical protein
MDCIDIHSDDNSVTVTKNECGVDLSVTSNNLSNILQFNDSECVDFVVEFEDGKMVVTAVIDWDCVASNVCEICNPPTCPAPIELVVALV